MTASLYGFEIRVEDRSLTPPEAVTVSHILMKPLQDGVWFVEIDFNGDYRPQTRGEWCGLGECGWTFSGHAADLPASCGFLDVIFKLPEGVEGATLIGRVMTGRVWRGILITNAAFQRCYTDYQQINGDQLK